MICRIWRGWTTIPNAPVYEELLRSIVIPDIEARAIPGLRSIQMMRRELGDETEFATIMWFDDIGAVKALAGEDYETAHIPAAARAVLSRFDERAVHYNLFGRREQAERS